MNDAADPATESLAGSALLVQFRQRTRRRAVLLVAWLEAALFGTGAVTTYLLPIRQTIEWLTFLLIGVACVLLTFRLLAAQRRSDDASENRLSVILIGLGVVGFLQRIYFAFHGALLDDPTIYAFRPILAFMPFMALAIVTLIRTGTGIVLVWALWALTAVISVSGVALHGHLDLQRDGVAVMLLWTVLGCPLFLLILNTIPPYEDVLKSNELEMQRIKATAAITEQLRLSEHRFRMAAKGLQVGVWEHRLPTATDPEHWWCSERFYQLLGYQPDELELSSRNLMQLVDEDQREAITELARASLKADDGFSMDLRVRVKSRRYRTFNVMAHWERDASGKACRLTGAISDIHDRVQAEEALHAAKSELQRLAYSDPLTDISNRRGFDERLDLEIARARRSGLPLSLLIIDLDHFKLYNDLYGHLSGDESLRTVSTLLQSMIHRPADLLSRIGGEEFSVLLPETPQEGALTLAKKMLEGVYALNLTHADSQFGRITCSIGIACANHPDATGKALFEAADKAMYEAKQSRNTLLLGQLAPPSPDA